MSAPRRSILYVIGTLDGGGAENHLCKISARLQKEGWQVNVFCLKKRGRLIPRLEAQGIHVHGIDGAPASPGLSNIRTLISASFQLFRYLRRHKPDVVHFFLPHAYMVGGLISLMAGGSKRVMSRRSLNNYQSRHHWILGAIEKKLHKGMDVILGNSNAVAHQLRDLENVPDTKLNVIYNGIETAHISDEEIAKSKDDLGIKPGEMILVIVANLIPYKGHRDLLEALALVKDRMPEHWRLLIVGEDRGHQQDLAQLCDQSGLNGHVSFLGWRQDIPAILRNADIGLLCSHEEGFSNAILEGMAAGLPYIVTDVGGNAEAVIDGETGYVVPPRAPEALGQAIVKLAQDPDFAAKASKRARKRLEEHFSIDRCIADYDRLYKQLVD